jgi:pimeloyl-ACP methyl ester carboxylesterase
VLSQQQDGEHEVKTSDRRVLTYSVTGDRDGTPVFLLHGTPGCRNGPKPRGSVLYRMGVRLISYDRPGYGGSCRQPGRRVADAAEDVKLIADEMGLDRFAVVGRSGGAPHALACAALLGDRLTRTAALVSVAPPNAMGLNWFHGMNADNVRSYGQTDDSARLAERLRVRAERIRSDPENLVNTLLAEMTEPDLRVVKDVSIRRLLTQSYSEALRSGPYGWIDDAFALRTAWGFDPEEIKGKVMLWHGADDNFSPVHHTHWLAGKIPGAAVEVPASTAHFGAVEVLPQILAWLTADSREELTGTGDGAGSDPLWSRA